jgi:hypothetical protein
MALVTIDVGKTFLARESAFLRSSIRLQETLRRVCVRTSANVPTGKACGPARGFMEAPTTQRRRLTSQ